jgi:hypothetical protein
MDENLKLTPAERLNKPFNTQIVEIIDEWMQEKMAGECYDSKILHIQPDREFHIVYFNSDLKITLAPSEENGTDLTLINEGIPDSEYLDTHAGWVSVLLNFKAVIDYKIDLRNHDIKRTWDQNYADN